MRVLSRRAPLGEVPACLSVLSWNILAPVYVRPFDARTGGVQPFAAFAWAEPASERLEWSARRPRISAVLRESAADVICLQEVQFESDSAGTHRAPDWLREALPDYAVRLPAQRDLADIAARNGRVLSEAVPVGNLIMYRTDRLEPLEPARANAKLAHDATTRVGLLVRGRPSSPLAALGPTALYCVHLDATDESSRVKLLAKCVASARATYRTRDVLIAGDFNTEMRPGSATRAFVDVSEPTEDEMVREWAIAVRVGDGSGEKCDDEATPTPDDLEAWASLHKLARDACDEQRIRLATAPDPSSGPTRAAYAPGQEDGECLGWRLDHMLYTPRTLTPSSTWPPLTDAEVAIGVPTVDCPSDHAPIAAVFEPRAAPSLPAEARSALLESLARLDALHASALDTMRRETDEGRRRLEEAEGVANADTGEGRRRRAPPASEAVREHMRAGREAERALKLAQRAERQATLDGLGELEIDVLEERLGGQMSGAEWVEQGPPRSLQKGR